MTDLQLFIPITKVDAAKRLVYGVITEEVPDKSGEIFDYQSGKEAVQKWSDEFVKATKGESKGNLRAMHDRVAAGKFTDIKFDDENRRIEGVAKVIDEDEWNKVQEGVYTGFSIGGGYAKRWTDPENPNLKRYTPELSEVSLVDNPCVPTAVFEFIKEDGSVELRKFNSKEETMTDTTKADNATTTEPTTDRPQDKDGVTQVWLAKDGSTFLTKAEALRRNVEVDAEATTAPVMEALGKLDKALAKAESKDGEAEADEGADGEKEDDAASGEADKQADEGASGDDGNAEGAAKSAEGEVAKGDEAVDAAKADEPKDLKKGMYAVANFANILQSIQYLQQDSQWEAEYEGDNSELPAKIKAWLAEGGTLLQEMVGEETEELTAAKAVLNECLAKAGARNSKSDMEHLKAVHKAAGEIMDRCLKMGMAADEDDAAEKADTGELEKVTAQRDALTKAVGDMLPKLDALHKRIEAIEAQPMPAKGVKKAISKSEDNGAGADNAKATEAFTKHLEGLTPEQRALELIKVSHRNPIAMKP